VHVSASIQDFFAVRYFQEVLGQRQDLVTVQAPFLTPAGFFIYGRYHERVAALLPTTTLAFTDRDDATAILHHLIRDNASKLCLFVGTISGFIATPDLLTPSGLLFLPAGGHCGAPLTPARSFGAFRRMRTRAFFSGETGHIFGSHVAGFAIRLAGHLNTQHSQDVASLFHMAIRLDPDSPSGWSALGNWLAESGLIKEAQRPLERALDLDPAFVPSWSDLLRVELMAGDQRSAALLIDRAFRSDPFRKTRAAPQVTAALEAGNLNAAVLAARAGFAEAAMVYAQALPNDPFSASNRDALLRYAAEITPR
jgi:tetratricopeptide (TPR) repeat protein